MTGPDTASYTIIGYLTKKVSPTPTAPFDSALAEIWVDSGQMKFTDSSKTEVLHRLAIYRPDADTNGDGIPEGAPLYCIQVSGVSTRVDLMTPCTP